MSPEAKLAATLAYLDHVIALDTKRTQGEWSADGVIVKYKINETRLTLCEARNWTVEERTSNATFIAGASVWSALMAKALRNELEQWNEVEEAAEADFARQQAQECISVILSYFPSEILKPFVK